MFLNMDQLQKQLDKDEFQEDGSMAAFWVINRQFQMFINLQFTLDYDSQMSDKYFAEYTGIEVKQFRETLPQHMSNVKKFITKRTRHQRQYDIRVNKRQMQTQESKVNLGKALDAGLVVKESSGTGSRKPDTSSMPGNDAYADNAYIKPIYDEEPMAEVQLTAECNIFATGQQHTKKLEIINEGRVDQMEAHCIALERKYQNQALKSGQHGQFLNGKINEAKVKHDIDEIKTINIELEHSVAILLAENEHLNKEKEHLKQTYKELYDSIKKTRVQHKDHNDSLIVQLNNKSTENANLKAQIQEKFLRLIL
ncbi:hypothetical protein Tco_0169461 [Tanacetum coccineum]